MPAAITIRGVTPQGDAGETFAIEGGKGRWKGPFDAGAASYSAPAFYVSQGGPVATTAWFVDALLSRPDKALDLLPGGRAQAARLADLQVGTGQAARTITLWAITGIRTSPLPVWADAEGSFFGLAGGLAWLPEAYAGEQSKIEEEQARAMAAQAPGLARALVTAPGGPVAFTGVRLFDAEAGRFVADQTVVVKDGLIAGAAVAGAPRAFSDEALTVPPRQR